MPADSPQEGEKSVAALISSLRRDADALTDKGELERALRKYTRALRLSRGAHTECSLRASIYFNRAVCLLRRGWYEEVLPDCDSAILIDLSWIKPYYVKGLALVKLGREREAMRYFLKILRMRPSIRIQLPSGSIFGDPKATDVMYEQHLLALALAPPEAPPLPRGWIARESRQLPMTYYYLCIESKCCQWALPSAPDTVAAVDAAQFSVLNSIPSPVNSARGAGAPCF
jgi:tetratricopeptide (TPR) repeat protein